MGYKLNRVHTDTPLTNFAQHFAQDKEDMIAHKLLPIVTSTKLTNLYYKFDRGNWRIADDERAPGSEANEFGLQDLTTDSFAITQYSGRHPIPYDEMEEADDPLEPKQDASMALLEKLLINREVRAAQDLFTTTAVESGVSLTASNQWDVTSTGLLADIDTGKDAVQKQVAKDANCITMGHQAWIKVKRHADIIDLIKYTRTGLATADLAASVFDVDNLFIGSSVKMTTPEGISQTTDYIWGKRCLINYRNPSARPTKKVLSHAYMFVKKGEDVLMKSWEEEKNEAVMVEGSLYYDIKIACTLCGYLISDCVS